MTGAVCDSFSPRRHLGEETAPQSPLALLLEAAVESAGCEIIQGHFYTDSLEKFLSSFCNKNSFASSEQEIYFLSH